MLDPASPEAVTAVAALIAPFVIAFLKRTSWQAWQKQVAVLAVAVCLAVVSMTAQEVAAGDTAWTLDGVLTRIVALAVAAQTLYALFLKQDGALYELPGASELLRRLERLGNGPDTQRLTDEQEVRRLIDEQEGANV